MFVSVFVTMFVCVCHYLKSKDKLFVSINYLHQCIFALPTTAVHLQIYWFPLCASVLVYLFVFVVVSVFVSVFVYKFVFVSVHICNYFCICTFICQCHCLKSKDKLPVSVHLVLATATVHLLILLVSSLQMILFSFRPKLTDFHEYLNFKILCSV